VSAGALLGGIALAAAAAACFDGAVALQAVEARAVRERAVGVGLLRALLRRRRWLAATALAFAGWPLQVAALALAPLTVVQPALALGLVVLLALGTRLLHEPVRPRDLAAVVVMMIGLALLAYYAPPAHHVHAGAATLAVVLGALGLIALAPWVARASLPGSVLVVAAGCAYAASGFTTALLADGLEAGALAAVLGWALASAVAAGAGQVDEMAALQRVGAARVAAGAFAIQTVVPVIGAPALASEHWQHPVPIIAGLALVTGAALVLGTARAVAGLVNASHG
jgi:drug/metabolite transporter (DMT)-like permease